jgi:hypothetical protein
MTRVIVAAVALAAYEVGKRVTAADWRDDGQCGGGVETPAQVSAPGTIA